MTSRRLAWICITTFVPMVVACGGASGGTAQPPAGQGLSQVSPSQVNAPSTATAGSSRAGSIDVCALLSEADAAAVARERKLDSAQTAATNYTLKATKVVTTANVGPPTSGCTFSIGSGGGGGTVEIDVVPAANIAGYADGKKVPGLGDEAYSGGGLTVVRVGDVMLQSNENSFTQGFVVALYRKMIPKLK